MAGKIFHESISRDWKAEVDKQFATALVQEAHKHVGEPNTKETRSAFVDAIMQATKPRRVPGYFPNPLFTWTEKYGEPDTLTRQDNGR